MQKYPFLQLVAVKDCLIQFRILHWVYLTSQRLNKMYSGAYPSCRKCANLEAGFCHMMWSCLKVHSFWEEVTQFITSLLKIPIPQTVSVCLLGLVGTLAHRTATKTLIRLLLFYARKAILLTWKQSEAPSLNSWKSLINSAIPLIKMTYHSSGCNAKFNKVWKIWLEFISTNAAQEQGLYLMCSNYSLSIL